jgi:hypothetical protein
VGRATTVMEAGTEKERVCGVDLVPVGETIGEAPAWTDDSQHDIEAEAKEERTHGMDPAVVGEAVSEALEVGAFGEVPTVEAWRQSRSGHVGDGEMIVAMVRV